MEETEIAEIVSYKIYLQDNLGISAHVEFQRQNGPMIFGGHTLFQSLPEDYRYLGHFIYRVLQLTGSENLDDTIGKQMKITIIQNQIVGMENLDETDGFYPVQDFEMMEWDNLDE